MATIFAIIFCIFVTFVEQEHQAPAIQFIENGTFGNFESASRIYIDYQGLIYIIDRQANKVFVFNDIHSSPQVVGGFGWSEGTFDTPTGIATDGVNFYVSDYGNHRIQRFDRKLSFINSWATRDNTDIHSRFGYPLGVVLSESGDYFILDGENIRVLKFNSLGQFDRSFGDLNKQQGKIEKPLKLLVSSAHHIYVLEPKRMLEYDLYGNYLHSLDIHLLRDAEGCTLSEQKIFVVSSNSINILALDGTLINQIAAKEIVAEKPINDIKDIAYRGNLIFLLTKSEVHIIQIVFSSQ